MRDFLLKLQHSSWPVQLKWLAVSVAVLLVLTQLLYPVDRIVPFATVDTVSAGGWRMKDLAWELDRRLNAQPIELRLGTAGEPYDSFQPREIGLGISNQSRVERLDYPWYLRMVPTSLFWHHLLLQPAVPDYRRSEVKSARYFTDLVGKKCHLEPKNATLTVRGDKLEVVPAVSGGDCKFDAALNKLKRVEPTLTEPGSVIVSVDEKAAAVPTSAVEALKQRLLKNTENGVALEVSGEAKTLPRSVVFSWLRFSVHDSNIESTFDSKKAAGYFAKDIAPRLAVKPGTTKIATRDFTVLSKRPGKPGRGLDVTATLRSLKEVLDDKTEQAEAVTKKIPPNVDYARSYTKSSTGIAAQLAHYDEDHAVEIAASFVELGGRGWSAAHKVEKAFTAASTYKLFVAYGTLKKIEAKKWQWGDDTNGGRDLETCFDDMIVKSDNACAEAMLERYGANELTKDIQQLGLTRSGWMSTLPQTTAGDLALFLTKLENDDLPLKKASRERLLDAMKRNQYRQGIPAGTAGTVADKVGFLNGLLHDAAIVYSPKGDYVLVIMTDGSSWTNIAELTRKIEALR